MRRFLARSGHYRLQAGSGFMQPVLPTSRSPSWIAGTDMGRSYLLFFRRVRHFSWRCCDSANRGEDRQQ
jgi:hypothetical protein